MKQRPKYRGNELQNDIEKDKNTDDEQTEMTIKFYNNAVRTTEIPLQEGDTLQALSIRYHCPLAELKRLNNLHKENEIFARRTLKIPYRPFSMPIVHKSGESSPDAILPKNSVDASILKQKLSTVSSPNSIKNGLIVHDLIDIGCSSSHTETNFNQIIFNTTIAHKEERTEIEEELLSDEEIQLLPNDNTTAEEVHNEFNCSGADWGVTWPVLLVIILVGILIGPIIYIFYIAEHLEKYHNQS